MTRIKSGGLLLVALMVLFALGGKAEAAWPTLKKGDVLVTRNVIWNFVPGYWNHSAMYDGAGYVIEAQPSLTGGRVKKTPLATFYNTYPQINVYRLNAQFLVPRMVQYANSLVGQPYQDPFNGGGYNCVMVIRLSYYYATLAYTPGGEDPRWVIPDNIASDRRFIYVGQK
jgi:uncharacterized protein YycO